MAAKRTHAKQHFVPRFLLDAWTGKDGKLGVFKRLPGGALRYDRRSPKAVAKIAHLYSLQRYSSNPDVFIEKDILGPHVDDIAAPIHRQLLVHGTESLSEYQRCVWARLLVTGLFRTPFMVSHFRRMGQEQVRMRSGAEAAVEGSALDAGLKHFLLAIGSAKYNEKMRSSEWWIVKVPSGWKDALICDLPFTYFGDFFGDAFALVMPISPRRFFVCATAAEYRDKTRQLTPAWMTEKTNTRLVQHASAYVYTTDNKHHGLVEKWLGKRAFGEPVETAS